MARGARCSGARLARQLTQLAADNGDAMRAKGNKLTNGRLRRQLVECAAAAAAAAASLCNCVVVDSAAAAATAAAGESETETLIAYT